MANGADERSGRELRLLLLVIAIAVAGLVVLARFRFPAADIVAVSPTPSPLERLAAPQPFEEQAAAVTAAAGRLLPLVAVVEIEPIPETPEKSPAKAKKKGAVEEPAQPSQRQFVLALRVRPDRWLAYQPKGTHPVRSATGPVTVAAEDAARELVLMGLSGRTESKPDVLDFSRVAPGFPGTSYVLLLEAAAAGPVLRPQFVPRLDPVSAPPWDSPILRVGGSAAVPSGAFLFSLEGRLIGLTVPQEDGVAIVAAATLDRLIGELAGAGQ
jgi:hypothetical protein